MSFIFWKFYHLENSHSHNRFQISRRKISIGKSCHNLTHLPEFSKWCYCGKIKLRIRKFQVLELTIFSLGLNVLTLVFYKWYKVKFLIVHSPIGLLLWQTWKDDTRGILTAEYIFQDFMDWLTNKIILQENCARCQEFHASFWLLSFFFCHVYAFQKKSSKVQRLSLRKNSRFEKKIQIIGQFAYKQG